MTQGTYFTVGNSGGKKKKGEKLWKKIVWDEEKVSHNSMDITDREEHFFVETSMERKQNGYEVLEKEESFHKSDLISHPATLTVS